MRVRPFRPTDSTEIQRVVKAVYDEFGFTWEADGYHKDLFDVYKFYPWPGGMFVAEDDEGNVIGCCALQTYPKPFQSEEGLVFACGKWHVSGADCQLNRLYVVADGRKNGAGTALSLAVIDQAKTNGFKCMEIWSDKLFVDAHRLYERLGAVVVGERVCDDPDEAPEWGLRLELV